MTTEHQSTLVLEQLLSGRDHARSHPVAGQMANFAYLIGCSEAGECLVVDPSWDPTGIVQIAESKGLKVVGGIATHGHPDHVGGAWMGLEVAGMRELCSTGPIHVHQDDLPMLKRFAGLADERVVTHIDGEFIELGGLRIELLHTPGHTPGGMCLLVEGHLISGDVLFVGACGRVDLPGAEPRKMYESLRRLGALPGDTVVLPGHDYGHSPRSTIAQELLSNPLMRAKSAETWLRIMGCA